MIKVAIIGAGQQGTSLARALATRSEIYDIAAFDTSFADHERMQTFEASFERDALKANITPYKALLKAVEGAHIIVLATPIDTFGHIVAQPEIQANLMRHGFMQGAILTDVGSAKAQSERLIRQALPAGGVYVPAHPIVGNAGQGPATSNADMYKGETIAIVPGENKAAIDAVRTMWHDAGAKTLDMSALQHDRLLGNISHLEHFGVAFPLTEMMNVESGKENSKDYRDYGSLTLDITRIANASPPMWEAIATHNRAQILLAAQGLRSAMDEIKTALYADTPAPLIKLLKPAHDFRTQVYDVKPRVRESLKSAVEDHIEIEKIRGNVDMAKYDKTPYSLSRCFNRTARIGFAERVALPACISAAVTLNAMNLEKEMGGISMRGAEGLRNPSFCDGSSVMLNDPTYVARLLHSNRYRLIEAIEKFEEKQDIWIDRVYTGDTNMRAEIARVAAIRQSAPPHRTGDALRAEHDVAVYPPLPAPALSQA